MTKVPLFVFHAPVTGCCVGAIMWRGDRGRGGSLGNEVPDSPTLICFDFWRARACPRHLPVLEVMRT